MTIRNLAEKIAKDFELSIRDKTDAIQYTNLGIDSTITEKKKVKSDSKYLYKLIKSFNEHTGSLLLNHLDT